MTEQALEAGGGNTPFFSPTPSGPSFCQCCVNDYLPKDPRTKAIDLHNMQMTWTFVVKIV